MDYVVTKLGSLNCNLIFPNVQDLKDSCSSKDDQVFLNDRRQEYQKRENRAVGKGTIDKSGILATCSLLNCVRSGHGDKVREQVVIINNKEGVMLRTDQAYI